MRTVVYFYTGDAESLQDRRLHTAFARFYRPLHRRGRVFAISSESPREQLMTAMRDQIIHGMLNDQELALARALGLPTFSSEGRECYERLVLFIDTGVIEDVIYPVSDPSRVVVPAERWIEQSQ